MSEPEIVNRLVVPPEEAERLVAQAGKVYLRECSCRSQMQVCPREKWEVCMLFEHASEKDRQPARMISADEAVRIIRMTTKRGDIHQLFYFQDGARSFELCNCCTCCCFPLREAKERGNYTEQLRCGYVAITDAALCTGCGLCLESCFFGARQLEDDALHLIDERCFGCGRCIASCPEDAIRLEFHAGRGVPIPNDNTHMTPHDLLERIHRDREALAALWCGLTEEQMIHRPGPQEDWSVKDLAAHVTGWESFILERVTDLINGGKSEPAEHQDVLNARVYEHHKDRPLADVLAAFDANWPKLEALISSLNDEQINTPAYYRTYDGVALLPILRAGTFGHYPGHIADLRTYFERMKSNTA